MLITTFSLSACFDDYQGTIDEAFWVYFQESSVSVNESQTGEVTAVVTLASDLASAATITYSIVSEGAVEGTDYTLPAESGSITIPAGQSSVNVVLLESVIDNTVIETDKKLTFTLQSAGNFSIGFPGSGEGNTFTVTIKEDDFTQLGYSSFEEPEAGDNYVDPLGANNDHDLVNNPGQNSVDYTSSGGEIGFNAIFLNTRDISSGLSDDVGVTDEVSSVGSFVDGSKGYSLRDTDGNIQVTFDPVDISGFTTTFIRMDWFVLDSNYEGAPDADDTGNDEFRIYVVDVDTGNEINLIDVDGDQLEIQYSDTFGTWSELRMDLSGVNNAQLVIEVDTNVDSEGIYFDNVQFLGL